MRLFTGLDLAPHVAKNIEQFVDGVKPSARIKWSPVANLHITTKFIGEWPEARLDELIEKLSIPRHSFSVSVEGLGFFPNARAPKIFWAGIASNPELAKLASATESALQEIGIEKEARVYSPHLTLARIPSPMALDHLLIDAPPSFGAFDVHAFHLYESRNSVYTKLASFPLK